MARSQPEIQALFETIPGVAEAYFQAPTNRRLKYPCIIYERDSFDTKYADNLPYSIGKRYTVTVIDPDPNSSIVEKVARLPTSAHNRWYAADDLNHDVFTLYL